MLSVHQHKEYLDKSVCETQRDSQRGDKRIAEVEQERHKIINTSMYWIDSNKMNHPTGKTYSGMPYNGCKCRPLNPSNGLNHNNNVNNTKSLDVFGEVSDYRDCVDYTKEFDAHSKVIEYNDNIVNANKAFDEDNIDYHHTITQDTNSVNKTGLKQGRYYYTNVLPTSINGSRSNVKIEDSTQYYNGSRRYVKTEDSTPYYTNVSPSINGSRGNVKIEESTRYNTDIPPSYINSSRSNVKTKAGTRVFYTVAPAQWYLLLWVVCMLFAWCSAPVSARVQQFSACRARVDNRVINLEPLQRLDGQPRLSVYADNQTRYCYNPCAPFNLPTNPHTGGGDRCYFVAMCMCSEQNSEAPVAPAQSPDSSLQAVKSVNTYHYFTLGIQSTIKFTSRPLYSTKIPKEIADIFHEKYPGMPENDGGARTILTQDDINPPKPYNIEPRDRKVVDYEDEGAEVIDSSSEVGIEDKQEVEYVRKPNDESDEVGDNGGGGNDISNDNSHDENGNEVGVDGNSTKGPSNSSRVQKDSEEDMAGISSYSSSEEMMAKVTILLLKGNKSYKTIKTYIYLLCDQTRQRPEDALFELVSVPGSVEKHFILQHQCSCPDGCPGYAPYHYGNNTDLSSQSAEEGELPKHLWLVVVINAAIIVIAIIIGGVFCRKGGSGTSGYYNMLPGLHDSRLTMGASAESLFRAKAKVNKRPDYLEYSSALTKANQMPSSNNGVIDMRDLEIGQRLGGGLFGDTYLAEWKERQVAAKRITVSVHQCQSTEEDHALIVKEINYLSKQKHKHLVSYIGTCTDTKQPYVITEFFETAESLKGILNRQTEGLSWSRKVKLCVQVADAITFLHSAKYPILHRDLRCANLLVDQTDRLKVVDYGMTKLVQRLRQKCSGRKGCFCNKEMCAVPSSVRWTAPEILAYPIADENQHFDLITPACDVYSYAMVLWEVATQLDPFEDIPDETEIMQIVVGGGRPPIDSMVGIPSYIQDLIKKCWSHDPANRPTMKNIANQMKSFIQVVVKDKRVRNTSTTSYMKSLLNTHLEN